jgi:hypothetical protein
MDPMHWALFLFGSGALLFFIGYRIGRAQGESAFEEEVEALEREIDKLSRKLSRLEKAAHE